MKKLRCMGFTITRTLYLGTDIGRNLRIRVHSCMDNGIFWRFKTVLADVIWEWD